MGVETTAYVWPKCYVLMLLASEDGCQSSAQGRDLESMAEACIDIKKLQQLLAGQQVNPTKALCSKFNSSACELQLSRDVAILSLSRIPYFLFCLFETQLFSLYLRTSSIYLFRQ